MDFWRYRKALLIIGFIAVFFLLGLVKKAFSFTTSGIEITGDVAGVTYNYHNRTDQNFILYTILRWDLWCNSVGGYCNEYIPTLSKYRYELDPVSCPGFSLTCYRNGVFSSTDFSQVALSTTDKIIPVAIDIPVHIGCISGFNDVSAWLHHFQCITSVGSVSAVCIGDISHCMWLSYSHFDIASGQQVSNYYVMSISKNALSGITGSGCINHLYDNDIIICTGGSGSVSSGFFSDVSSNNSDASSKKNGGRGKLENGTSKKSYGAGLYESFH